MKIKHLAATRQYFPILLLLPALALTITGCNGSYGGGGGGNAPYISVLSVSSGPLGTPVTITGTKFGAAQGSSTVTFNGTAGTPTSWSDTSIVVPVPTGATTGPVVVTVGGVASNSITFTITSASAPTITSLAPASGQVGTSVAIMGTNFGATQGTTSTVNFNGTIATTITGWSATSITAKVPVGATTGNVVVTVGGVPSNGMLFTVTSGTSASTWTFVQDGVITSCNAGSSSCIFQNNNVIPTTAGSVMLVRIHTPNNVTITSVSGGGGTWQLCPASSCHLFDSAINDNQDIAYSLSGTGGATNFTVNLSGAASGFFGGNFMEFLPPPGSIPSFDAANVSTSATCTTCSGAVLAITATDLIVQVISGNGAGGTNAWKAFSAPYLTDYASDGINLNATSGIAPTITLPSAGADFTGIAFKTNLGSYTPPSGSISVVNYTSNTQAGITCNPSCSFSVPSTGSGHLLYLQGGASSFISSVSGGGTWVVPSGCRIAIPGSTGGSLSCAYVLSSTSGAVTVNVTMQSGGPAAFALWEIASAGSQFSLDNLGTAQRPGSPNLTVPGVALVLSGTNDVIFQSAWISGGSNAISLYPGPENPDGQGTFFYSNNTGLNNAGSAVLLNTTNGTAPIWMNGGTNSAGTGVTGIAFSAP
jgi:hypothetical protein